MLVFGGVTHQRSLFTCNLAYTPGKINFPNLNISQLKLEDNLPNLHLFGSVLIFGCIQLCMLLKLMRFQDGVVQAVAEAQEGFPGGF